LEKEADYTFNNDLIEDSPKLHVEDFIFKPNSGVKSESFAVSKNLLVIRPRSNSANQCDTSVASQISNEASVIKKKLPKCDSFCKPPKEMEISTQFESNEIVCKRNTPTANWKIDEGDLVFLIRKVDRKTNKSVLLTKHRKKITKCEHTHLEYYAKGMCKNCYHNKGKRSKKATKCEHKDRDHYAKGLCKNCYLHFFHIKKKQRKASESSHSAEVF
jgi:hypothetical protein